MKKRTLLIIPMCLLLTLGACTQKEDTLEVEETSSESSLEEESSSDNQEEVFEVIETDVENVLLVLSERDLSIDHFQGLNYSNCQDEYVDLGSGYILWESMNERVLVADNNGEISAIEEFIISMFGYELEEYSQYGYFDGTTLYENSYGECYSMDVPNMNKGTFTSYPEQVIGYCVEQYTDFIGLTSIMSSIGYSFSGSISEGSEGSTKISVNIDADYSYEEGGEQIEVTGFMLLELTFSQDDKLVDLTYTVNEYYEYEDVPYFLTQELVCKDYLEDVVPTPSWLDTYFPDRETY